MVIATFSSGAIVLPMTVSVFVVSLLLETEIMDHL